MRFLALGRTQWLAKSIETLIEGGHELVGVLSAPAPADYEFPESKFRDLAEKYGVPFESSVRISRVHDWLQDARAEIGVSVNYPTVIPAEAIALFPHGILNGHAGDLPRFRGNACVAWAILTGEARLGLCVHKMVGGELDSGDIISRAYLDLDPVTTITDAYSWILTEVPVLFRQALEQLSIDPEYVLERQSTDPLLSLRCYPRMPEDGRIDWSQSSAQVLRLVNASTHPYGGAFGELNGERVTIWRATTIDESAPRLAVPGQVMRSHGGIVDVACGEGTLRILESSVGAKSESLADKVTSIRLRFT